MQENLLDLKYVNRDGDTMRGPLGLAGDPSLDAHAASKRYIDTVLATLRALSVLRDGSNPMTGPLTLAGVPTLGPHATTKDYTDALAAASVAGLASEVYVDAADAVLAAAIAAGDALRVPLDGSVAMTGLLTLSGAPVNNLHAATKLYVDSLPVPGLNTFDATVAPAGGDYTSIVTACATEGANARIFVKPGTYMETANIHMNTGQQIIGQNPEDTIIDFGAANRKIFSDLACENLAVANLTIQGSIADYTVELQGHRSRVDNCRIIGSAAANDGVFLDGTFGVISRCYFTLFSKNGTFSARTLQFGMIIGNGFFGCKGGIFLYNDSVAMGNEFEQVTQVLVNMETRSVLTGNRLGVGAHVNVSGHGCTISGNYVAGVTGIFWDGGHENTVITGNYFDGSRVLNQQAAAQYATVTGNVFNGGAGVETAADRWTISGNTFRGAASIVLTAAASDCLVSGNNMDGSTTYPHISDAGEANTAIGNSGVELLQEKTFHRMENTSGGALVAGDVVVFKAVAVGDEFTTTVNQGDDMVVGMLEEGINNNAYGKVQTLGKTVKLKVNGVINIGIGDLLGTFTAAGIAMQAQAGDMAFAIALEAYAGADSNGVIDALLVTPRKI